MFANCTIGMIENETGNLLECLKLYENLSIKVKTSTC